MLPRNLLAALLYFEEPQQTYWEKHAKWPKFLVYAGWFIRNPFPGLTLYFGMPYVSSTGTAPGTNWNPEGGFNFLTIHGPNGITRPFVSFRGLTSRHFRGIEFYFGWKPTRPISSFGIAFRVANAKPETGPHSSGPSAAA